MNEKKFNELLKLYIDDESSTTDVLSDEWWDYLSSNYPKSLILFNEILKYRNENKDTSIYEIKAKLSTPEDNRNIIIEFKHLQYQLKELYNSSVKEIEIKCHIKT